MTKRSIDGIINNTFDDIFIDSVGYLFGTSNQLVFGSGNNTTTINVKTPSAPRIYTIPDIGADGMFYISGGSMPDITGSLIPTANNTYDIGSSTYNWKNLYMEGTANLSSASNQIVFGGNTTFNINCNGYQTVNFPNPQGSSDIVVYNESPATMQNKSFSDTTNFTPTSNQMLFGGNLTLNVDSSAAKTITLPNATDTIVLEAATQNLSNKSISSSNLTNPIIYKQLLINTPGNQIVIEAAVTLSIDTSISGTINFPSVASDTVVYEALSQTLSNKSFSNTTNFTPTSNQIEFGGNLVFNVDTSGSGTISFPNATDTVVYEAASQTLTNKTLSSPIVTGSLIPSANATYDLGSSTESWNNGYLANQLNLTSPGAQIVFGGNTTWNINTNGTQSLTFSNLQGSSDYVVYQETPATMQNKSFSDTTNFTPTSNRILFGGNLTLNVDSSAANTITLPNATDTIVLEAAVQTLTNKTFAESLIPSANAIYNLGSYTESWNNGYIANQLFFTNTSNQIEFGGGTVFNVNVGGLNTITFPNATDTIVLEAAS